MLKLTETEAEANVQETQAVPVFPCLTVHVPEGI
jgi:hypothetical protein